MSNLTPNQVAASTIPLMIIGFFLLYALGQILVEVRQIKESSAKLDFQMGKAIQVIHWEMSELNKMKSNEHSN